MEKTERLKKFNLSSVDEITETTFDNLVTWNLHPVDIVSTIKTTSGDRLVGIIRGEDYDSLHTFTFDGRCVGSNNGDLDLYIDDSIDVKIELYINNGRIESHCYLVDEISNPGDISEDLLYSSVVKVSASKLKDILNSAIRNKSTKSIVDKIKVKYTYIK